MSETGDIRIDEIMPQLFDCWSLLRFEDCLLPVEGGYAKLKAKDIYQTGNIPVVDQGENYVSGYVNDISKEYSGQLPVVIFGDHTRRIKFVDFKFAVGADGTKLLHPKEFLVPRFFYYYLCVLKIESQGYSRHYRFLKEVTVPIPPLNEQRRIVAKLEELLTKVDASQKRLAKIPVILKRFRQAVLAAACSGRLTADWREEHTLPLAPSRQGRGNHKGAAASKAPSPLVGEGRGEGEELPEGWSIVQFDQLINELKNGVSPRPNLEPPGIPILRIGAIRGGSVDFSDVRYMPNGEAYLSAYQLKEKDLLFTRYNGSIEFLGVCGMVRSLQGQAFLYPDKLMRVRVKADLVLPEYVEVFFQTQSAREKVVEKVKSSAGQNGISGTDIKKQFVALPPLPEQQEIVRRVEALFTLADQLEARYLKGKAYVDKLTQSILAKTFRGELVPQDPNDEPASVLLERIRAERAKAAPAPRRLVPLRSARKTYMPEPEPIPMAAEPAVAYIASKGQASKGSQSVFSAGSKGRQAAFSAKNQPVPVRILTAMQPGRDYSRAEITAATGISDAEWTWTIRQLKEEGKVRQMGERRGARYRRK